MASPRRPSQGLMHAALALRKVSGGISRSLRLTSQQFAPSPWPPCTCGSEVSLSQDPALLLVSSPHSRSREAASGPRSKFTHRKPSRASRGCHLVLSVLIPSRSLAPLMVSSW